MWAVLLLHTPLSLVAPLAAPTLVARAVAADGRAAPAVCAVDLFGWLKSGKGSRASKSSAAAETKSSAAVETDAELRALAGPLRANERAVGGQVEGEAGGAAAALSTIREETPAPTLPTIPTQTPQTPQPPPPQPPPPQQPPPQPPRGSRMSPTAEAVLQVPPPAPEAAVASAAQGDAPDALVDAPGAPSSASAAPAERRSRAAQVKQVRELWALTDRREQLLQEETLAQKEERERVRITKQMDEEAQKEGGALSGSKGEAEEMAGWGARQVS